MPPKILLTSVPAKDIPYVETVLPGSVATSERLSADLVSRNPDTEVLSVMVHDPVEPEILEGFAGLRGVVTRSTGHDHLPLRWLRARGVEVCNLGDYAVGSVVQHTVALGLSLLRRVPEAMAVTQGAMRGGRDPPRWDRSRLVGRNLEDVTVGVLGTGRIGAAVARAFSGLGATVTGHDVAPDAALRALPRFRYVDPFSAFLSGADLLTIHVPLTPATRHMLDRQALARLPPGAVVLNTARGRVVDVLAVERALRSGRLGGFATDVLPGEPDPPLLPRFRDLTNVIITPHLGAYDRTAIRARYDHTRQAAEAILAGNETELARYRVSDPAQAGAGVG